MTMAVMSLCVSAASSPTQHQDKGHAIYTYKSSPTIAVINTYFSDPNDNNNFYHLWITNVENVFVVQRVHGSTVYWHLQCSGQQQRKVGRKMPCASCTGKRSDQNVHTTPSKARALFVTVLPQQVLVNITTQFHNSRINM